jgi:putative hemolysin
LEPPQFIQLTIGLLSAIFVVLVASYEATFSVLSRSALEKMNEAGIKHAALMLRIYEPRHRLRLLASIGEALGIIALTICFWSLIRIALQSFQFLQEYGVPIAAILTLGVFLLASSPRRLRFDEDSEETRIPSVALAFVPLHSLLVPLTNLLDRLAVGDSTPEDFRAEKEEELRSIVESESETGVIEEGEKEMIQGVFGFHDRIAREVMVPRVDVTAFDESATLGELLEMIEQSGHSRVPLYRDTLDNIRGIIFARDLLQLLISDNRPDLESPLTTILMEDERGTIRAKFVHEPYYVPETKMIDEVLDDFRNEKKRLAIVVDEYGGTAGLLTTEDLVEEIVGEIRDESDDEEELFRWEEPNEVLLANARINIDDLNATLETDLPNEGFETLAGFVFDHLGTIPKAGATFQVGALEMTVLDVDGQRITKVRIKRLSTVEDDSAEE